MKKITLRILLIAALGVFAYFFPLLRDLYLALDQKKVNLTSKSEITVYWEETELSEEHMLLIDSSQIVPIYQEGFPQVRVFNAAGQPFFIMDCMELIPDVVDLLIEHPEAKPKNNLSLTDALNGISNLNESLPTTGNQPEFTFIFYWASWQPSLMKRKMREMEVKIKELSETHKLKLYYVNVDFQTGWEKQLNQFKKIHQQQEQKASI